MRGLLIGVVVALIVLAGGAIGAWYYRNHQGTPEKHGSATIQFVTTATPSHKRTVKSIETVPWPMYGYDAARTHNASQFMLRPPFRRIWTLRTGNIIEFPPVVGYGLLFVNQYRGRFFAIDAATGKRQWRKHFLNCGAASPAIGKDIVYQAYMQPYPCNRYPRTQRGFIVAILFRGRHGNLFHRGRILWRFKTGAIESSPLLVHGVLYFGSWDHYLYALDVHVRTRPRLLWKFDTGDEIDSSAAYANGRVFIGTNGGHVFALNARTGKELWRASSFSGFLRGREYFYATPTLAYGRVYIGNTDGTLYAYGQRTGDLLWAQHAGTYIYTAAAVWRREVIVGTYDGYLIAYDAATGDVIWRHAAPAAIHGAPTVLDGLVYFSTCATCGSHGSRYAKAGPRGIYAVDARTGRLVWTFPDGQYSPVVADSQRVYLVGKTHVYGMVPASKYRAYVRTVLRRKPPQ
ncbi:MAG TPA: PQQ-binding-like beta-propeller repeat protein [Gaiellaceae bacterium]|nr:PQQ-binding-like beta-propeller repeat protein [Gaiellaceae bacterium]